MSSENERNRNKKRKEEQEETTPGDKMREKTIKTPTEIGEEKCEEDRKPKASTSEEDRKPEASAPPKKKSKIPKDIRIEDSEDSIKLLQPASAALRKVVYKAAGTLGLLEQGGTFFGRDTIEMLEGIGVLTVREYVKSVLNINYKLNLKGDFELDDCVLQAILDASLEIMTVKEL
jgi:hypothetical protein